VRRAQTDGTFHGKDNLVTRRILSSTFKYGVGIALLGYVIWRNWDPPGGQGLAEALQRPVQVLPLLLAVGICLTSVLLTFVRWYILVRAQDLPFTLANALRLGMIGYFLSVFLPGSIGGDVIKAAFIAREQRRRTVAVATVLIDRAVGLWGLFWLVALCGGVFWLADNPQLHAQYKLQLILGGALAVVAASGLLWGGLGFLPEWRAQRFAGRLSRIPKVGGSAAEFWRAIWMYRCQGRSVALALLLAFIGHAGFVLTFFFAAQVLQPPGTDSPVPSLAEQFLIVPVGMVVQALSPTPGGMGLGELSFQVLYEMVGRPPSAGALASLVYRVLTWVIGLAGYLVYLRMRPALAVARSEPGVDVGDARPQPALDVVV
jgi:uncharacterized membrane protein YbhN (UPF0104 family)